MKGRLTKRQSSAVQAAPTFRRAPLRYGRYLHHQALQNELVGEDNAQLIPIHRHLTQTERVEGLVTHDRVVSGKSAVLHIQRDTTAPRQPPHGQYRPCHDRDSPIPWDTAQSHEDTEYLSYRVP